MDSKQVVFEFTNKCNRNCVYCDRQEEYTKSNYKPATLNVNDIQNVISKLSDRFTPNNQSIVLATFTGGEPLFDEDTTEKLFCAAKYCNDIGLKTDLYTNGTRLFGNSELLEETYKYFSFIQIGVHDYNILDSYFDIIRMKIQNTEYKDKRLKLHFIINAETSKHLPQVKEEIEKIGLSTLLENEISFNFFDMAPVHRSKYGTALPLPKGAAILEELKAFYEDKFIDSELPKSFMLVATDKLENKPSTCDTRNAFYFDAQGNLRFCAQGYGPVFGNINDDNFEDALKRRENFFKIFTIYDPYNAPYLLAKKHALAENVNFDKLYRPYCALTLSYLFKNYGSAEELIESLEMIVSKTEPLEIPEKYCTYDLTTMQKRVLHELLIVPPDSLADKDIETHIHNFLPEDLVNELKHSRPDGQVPEGSLERQT